MNGATSTASVSTDRGILFLFVIPIEGFSPNRGIPPVVIPSDATSIASVTFTVIPIEGFSPNRGNFYLHIVIPSEVEESSPLPLSFRAKSRNPPPSRCHSERSRGIQMFLRSKNIKKLCFLIWISPLVITSLCS
jgi:hypothetical protein